MIEAVRSVIFQALGIGLTGKDLNALQMGLRALLVYAVWLVIVRVADRRLLGKYSAFDVVLAVILGAVLGRAITGFTPFLETLAAAAILVGVHWVFAVLSFRSHRFGRLVKGDARMLVRDGRVQRGEMRKSHLTERDLVEMLRLHGRLADPAEVKAAYLERNGEISAIPLEHPLRVVEVGVKDRVQTIRIEF